MNNDSTYQFAERFQYSEGIELERPVTEYLLSIVPGATEVVRSSTLDDKSGTDYWITRTDLPALSVDVKHRSVDPIELYKSDDACIEIASVYKGAPGYPRYKSLIQKWGWTLDASKRTDYIVYTWPSGANRRRFWIVNFPLLCAASQLKWHSWANDYGVKDTRNAGYLTLCCYPPRAIVKNAMDALTEGQF